MARSVIVFDVNETLLDMSVLDPLFQSAFGDAKAREEWFMLLTQLWMTATILDAYKPFDKLSAAALDMLAEKKGFSLGAERKKGIASAMLQLPAHADVQHALSDLRAGGLVLAALTNGTLKSARAQLNYAGLTDHFEEIMSADEVKRFKPARESYAFAARRLRARATGLRLVAAHAWDIAGAAAAGWKTAFVKRPGKVLNPGGIKPDVQATSLTELARRLLKAER